MIRISASTQSTAGPSIALVSTETDTPNSGSIAVRVIVPWNAPMWPKLSMPLGLLP